MTGPQDSPVGSYLDAMFDRLAGTGGAGRRLLSDAETHLEESAAAGRDRGLTEIDAERDAVARFGSVDSIARRVQVSNGSMESQLRRMLTGGWAFAAIALLWYGLSGILTWLLHWPWSQLLVATGGFGSWPACGEVPGPQCVETHISFVMVPWGGASFPYLFVALTGFTALVALLVLRGSTRLGTPAWTPSLVSMTLCVAFPFSTFGVVLVFYGVVDLAYGYYSRFAYIVAGTLALALAGTALKRRRRGARVQ